MLCRWVKVGAMFFHRLTYLHISRNKDSERVIAQLNTCFEKHKQFKPWLRKTLTIIRVTEISTLKCTVYFLHYFTFTSWALLYNVSLIKTAIKSRIINQVKHGSVLNRQFGVQSEILLHTYGQTRIPIVMSFKQTVLCN